MGKGSAVAAPSQAYKKDINMRQGTVKWYNGKKCYGFVSPETPNDAGNKDDVFVHSSSLQAAGIRFLNEGDVIKFDEEIRNGKLSATTIELVSRDEDSARKFQERRSSYRHEGGEHRGGDRGPRRDRDDGDRKAGWAFWKK